MSLFASNVALTYRKSSASAPTPESEAGLLAPQTFSLPDPTRYRSRNS